MKPTGALPLSSLGRLLAGGGEGVFACDRDFRCLYWNPLLERLLGLSAEDVAGQNLLTLFPFLVETGEEQQLRRALAGEEVTSPGRRFSVPGTNRRGFYDGVYGPLTEGGVVTGIIGVVRDVTGVREAAERLGETEHRFRHMADASPVLLWMSDTDALCTFFNQTWLDFTGRTQAQEWGVGWAEGVYFEDFQRCMDTYLAAFNRRETFEMEYRLRRKDGQYRWLLDRGSPRYTPDGTFAGFIGSCIDIHERRSWEAQLRRAVQARDEFLSVASHELKTPLTSLQLQIEALGRQLDRRPEAALSAGRLQTGVRAISEQTRRLGDLIEVLLDVSRINSGRLRFEYRDIDYAELVRDTGRHWRGVAEAAGARLSVEMPPGADAAEAAAVPGRSDRTRLEQILNNLLSNAVKYGPGKPISLCARADGERICFTVSDQGIGIQPSDRSRIFERFERGVPSRNYGGLGLGLWITNEIVRGLGGTISVESEPGQGARFIVELPRAPASHAQS